MGILMLKIGAVCWELVKIELAVVAARIAYMVYAFKKRYYVWSV